VPALYRAYVAVDMIEGLDVDKEVCRARACASAIVRRVHVTVQHVLSLCSTCRPCETHVTSVPHILPACAFALRIV